MADGRDHLPCWAASRTSFTIGRADASCPAGTRRHDHRVEFYGGHGVGLDINRDWIAVLRV